MGVCWNASVRIRCTMRSFRLWIGVGGRRACLTILCDLYAGRFDCRFLQSAHLSALRFRADGTELNLHFWVPQVLKVGSENSTAPEINVSPRSDLLRSE